MLSLTVNNFFTPVKIRSASNPLHIFIWNHSPFNQDRFSDGKTVKSLILVHFAGNSKRIRQRQLMLFVAPNHYDTSHT